MARSNRKPASQLPDAAAAAVEESIEELLIQPPTKVPQDKREAYWNGLMAAGNDAIRAAIATVEFFPLLQCIPPAIWEKRLLVYLYRTAPKVKNASNERNFTDKITHPFDEEHIKQTWGGGSYTAYLNLDRETQLKQCSFSIDLFGCPPKYKPGQVLIDANGNEIGSPPAAPGATPGQNAASEVSQAIEATSEANKAGFDLVTRGAEKALDLQAKILERNAGLSGHGNNDVTSKLLELALQNMMKPQPDPMTTALQLLERLEKISSARNQPLETSREPLPMSEVNQIVEAVSGSNLPDLIKSKRNGGGEEGGWVNVALSAAGKLIENLPTIIAQVNQNQEANFRRAVALENYRRGAAPPIETHTLPSAPPPPAAGGPRVQSPPATFPSQTAGTVVWHEATGSQHGSVVTEVPVPPAFDFAKSVPYALNLIATRFNDGYTGDAVAQAIDVLFPGLFDQLAVTVLDEQEMTKLVEGEPQLKALTGHQDWPQFRADFVEFVRDQYESAGSDTGKLQPVAVTTHGVA